MTQSCSPFDPVGHYVGGVLSYVDCQTANLAEQGYRAIGAGTQFASALDGLLIIAVAVFGYRMLVGETPALRDSVALVVKIGFVLALAQHWSAYQPAVFNLAKGAPQALVADMFGQAGARPGQIDSGLTSRFETVSSTIELILHPERATGPGLIVQPRPVTNGPVNAGNSASPEMAPDTRELLTSADNTLNLTVLVSGVSLRIALAILLALGPVFVATLLFQTSRALFAGWIRALVGTMLGLVGMPVVLALELAVVEPQTSALVRSYTTGGALGALPERLWVSSSVFALVMLIVMVLIARAATTIRFPEVTRKLAEWIESPARQSGSPAAASVSSHSVLQVRDHAQHVADAARAAARRDDPDPRAKSLTAIIERYRDNRQRQSAIVEPHQLTAARASRGRISGAAQRRDGT